MENRKWYKEAIIYQIYPFSFKDSNNDGMGDIQGIISKLDYIKHLGITAIWFSPLYKTPYKDYGYDISDYREINPDIGTMQDFEKLVEECHSREIKVIMDMVINHTSDQHKWFQEALKDKNSPYRDYYIIREGIKKGDQILPPTNWKSLFTGSAWERIQNTNDFYLHLFCKEQPDLNWENEKVREEIYDIIKFWLDKGVNGFRFDVFNLFSKVHPLKDDPNNKGGECFFIDGPRIHEFLNEMNLKILSKYEDIFTVGESYKPSKKDALEYVKEKNNELCSIFNFSHLDSDNNNNHSIKLSFDLIKFKEGLINPQVENFREGSLNTLVLENHDTPRSNSRFGIDYKKYRYEASTFLPLITFFGYGIPFIYMGQEIGETNVDFNSIDEMMDPVSHFVFNLMNSYYIPKKLVFYLMKNRVRDHARVPMQWDSSINSGFNEGAKPWQRLNLNYKEINVKKDLESNKSIYKFYQKVIKLKKENRTLIYGDLKEYEHNNKKIIAYSRSLDNETLFIIGNFSGKELIYIIPEELKIKEIIISNYEKNSFEKRKINLKPYEAILFKCTK